MSTPPQSTSASRRRSSLVVTDGDLPELPELEPPREAPPLPIPEEPTLPERLWRLVRDRKWVILQALIIIPLAVLALTLHQQKTYTATANLLFHQQPDLNQLVGDTSSVTDPTRTFQTNKDLINLPTVSQRAARQLGDGHTAAEVRSDITVKSTDESDVVGINAATASPKLSADMANAYVNAYVSYRRDADRSRLQGAIKSAQADLAALSPTDRAGTQGQQLSDRLDSLRLAQSLQGGAAEVVQRATPPDSPSSPSLARNLILGILVALVAGFGLAAILEQLDRRVKVVDDVESVYRLPVIARVPRSPLLHDMAMVEDREAMTRSLEIEAFRILRGNLRYLNFGHDIKSILVASASQGDGKSTVARHLAMTMASMGDSVVLVEGDLHKGSSPLVGEQEGPGLSGLLVGASLQEALVRVELPTSPGEAPRRLTVLPSGPTPPNASELLGSMRMLQVLHGLEKVFDLVILDSPPLSAVSDALALVPEVSGVVVVCGLGESTRDSARRLRKELALLGGRALGVVANFAPRGTREYSPYTSSV